MNCSLIINKLREYCKVNTDTALSKILGVSQATISAWRQRNTIDFALIIDKIEDIDLNWLLRDNKSQNTTYQSNESAQEQLLMFYKDAYEKKCQECDAANMRLDKIIDNINNVFGGLRDNEDNINYELRDK